MKFFKHAFFAGFLLLNGNLSYAQDALKSSEAMDAEQLSNALFTGKLKEGCSFTGGQEIQAAITTPTKGDAGIYLLNIACGTKNSQSIFIVQPTEAKLVEVLYATLGDNKTESLSFQESTRRLFASANQKMREIEWQPPAKKRIKEADMKSDLNKALFGKTVPKGKLPDAG